jgi:reactive intermediate/imine deaminase
VVAGLRPGETDQVAAYDRAFARIGAALAKAGVGWDDVVEMTIYHTEIADLPQFIAAKRKHVRAPYPAWTAIDIDRLDPDSGLVEIRVIARKPKAPVFTPSELPYPFSSAVRVGDVLYLSGEIGADESGRAVVPGGIESETRAMFQRIGKTLKAHGRSFDDLFKCQVFLADIADWPRFNAISAGYFKAGRYPARSALGVNGLALGAKVEMECWAWAG